MSFKSWNSYMNFSYSVRCKSRYVLEEVAVQFLEAIKNTCQNRVEIIHPNSAMWRAQMGHDTYPLKDGDVEIDEILVPYPEKRMRPLSNSASEGRANPKGIPYLYVASDKETAMSEIRPWLGSVISIARFTNIQELRIIDFSKHHNERLPCYLCEPDDAKKIEAVWTYIDNAFSQPVTNNDQKSDYVPTQIIAEFIRSLGYDGIAFKSSLSKGHNLALFNVNSVSFKGCNLFTVKNVEFSFVNSDDKHFR
ncbi:RES family NAD+ phosphorylase [Shewanella oncorhynchi]|uniref:RES family NAD+ phosphorylase n=2 Tax=Shewanella TaxID=22 RepID=UPI00222D448D|nr:RES family NAD+ phosphorylase [Shewanella baltica]MCS6140497.1 RES family NAD+ phosphorylase [Shewanella baltica]MCS6146735.1 RES family NAD+ phosphorylase [Shewanella baltica]MCS6171265.1 RES family NAD+ phosphorylase [Shewanella baltica]MCS6188489.1 RES family NAD+ phosphorylase [Shewanella baltica]